MECVGAGTRMRDYMMYPRFLLGMDLTGMEQLVYVLLLDRARMSGKREDWRDEAGRAFLVYTIKELAGATHKCESTVKRALATLEERGLIRREQKGMNRANRIFVMLPSGDGAASGEGGGAAPEGSAGAPSEGRKDAPIEGRGAAPLEGVDGVPIEGRGADPSEGLDNAPPDGSKALPPRAQKRAATGVQKCAPSNNYPERTTQQELRSKGARRAYGQFGNVYLTDGEAARLRESVPGYREYIERLSSYMASTGKTYRDHFATLHSWALRDRPAQASRSYDYREGESL